MFFIGLILVGFAARVGFFTVGFTAAGLEGFGSVGLGPVVFELPGLEEVGRAIVGFGPEGLVALSFGDVFPGVGLDPAGFLGVSQTAPDFEAVGLGLLDVLRVGLGVTEFKYPQDKGASSPVCIKERGVVDVGLGRTPSLVLTAEDPPAPFIDVQRKLVGVKVKVRLGGNVWANSGGACWDGRGSRGGGAGL